MAEAQSVFRAPPKSAMRPIVMPDSLGLLTGPEDGTVELPIHIDWTASNVYDLSSPQRLRTLYSIVLENALSVEDFRYLNRGVLRDVWLALRLPQQTRAAWELAFPELTIADDDARWENEGGHPAY